MSILFEKPGLLTTVQDLGRFRYRRFGINPNGAMDRTAARLINTLLGNDENEAVLELHFPAPEITFGAEAYGALGGADFAAHLNERRVDNWQPFYVQRGDRLRFADKIFGQRAYLSVKGGLRIDRWLGSASTNLKAFAGGYCGRSLKTGDRIDFRNEIISGKQRTNIKISPSLIPFYSKFPTVRVIAGAEFELLTAISQETFLTENFVISAQSDRMGYRLAGPPLHLLHEKQLVSSAVSFGTIQLLPDGQMIVLMADHQTSGGYPRLGNILPIDLPLVAQLGPHEKIAFHKISIEEGENLLLQAERNLKLLAVGCKF